MCKFTPIKLPKNRFLEAPISVTADKSCLESFPWTSPDIAVSNRTYSFTSALINISCAASVRVILDAEGIGADTSEYCRVYYKLNGGAQEAVLNKSGAFAKKTFSSAKLSGNTLQLVFSVKTNAAGKTFNLSNIKVIINDNASDSLYNEIKEIDNTKDKGILIYPNPVSNMLNIDFADAEQSKEIKLFNSVGQLVYSSITSNSSTQIDIQSLQLKGMIIAQIISDSKVSCHKILVR